MTSLASRPTLLATAAFLFQLFLFQSHAQVPDQDTTRELRFLPEGMLFPPLAAHMQEPRLGLRKQVGSSKMKLDIGNAVDLFEYFFSPRSRLRMGVDFFAYALTTSSQGLRLQVDAVDGFFGGHLSYLQTLERSSVGLRLRILHLSAHFIDGHYDLASKEWKDGREPIPFTRDYGELTAAYSWGISPLSFTIYSGFSYATLVRPAEIKRVQTIHGVEIHTSDLLGPVLHKPCNLFVAQNLRLMGIPAYTATHNIEFGLKIGEWSSSGVRLYGSYTSGLDIFSEYYDVRTEYWGLGFAFDFW